MDSNQAFKDAIMNAQIFADLEDGSQEENSDDDEGQNIMQ